MSEIPQSRDLVPSDEKYPVLNSLPVQDRVLILLTAAKLKPVSESAIQILPQDKDKISVLDDKLEIISNELNLLGLHSVVSHRESIQPRQKSPNSRYRLVQSEIAIVRYSTNQDIPDLPEITVSDANLGVVLGYPKSAVDAFPNNSLPVSEVPDFIKDDPAYQGLFFKMSRNNYLQEWTDYKNNLKKAKILCPEVVSGLNLDETIPHT